MSENPPAFPRTGEGVGNPRYDEPGMSLRDYFAGQALAGYFATPNTPHMNAVSSDTAEYIYAMADAMLVARAKVSV